MKLKVAMLQQTERRVRLNLLTHLCSMIYMKSAEPSEEPSLPEGGM